MLKNIFIALSFIIVSTQSIKAEEIETRTKIVCTIGPASDSKEKLGELVDVGMNVTRLNFSHGSHEGYADLIKRIKEVRKEKDKALAILLDTKGPEVRVGQLPEEGIMLEEDGEYWLVDQGDADSADEIPINPFSIVKDLNVDTTVLFDDGAISSTVIRIDPGKGALIKVHNGAKLSSRKGVNIPNATLSLPNVTEQDIKDIRFGCQQGVDMIALSFTRSAEHITEVRKILAEEGREDDSSMMIIQSIGDVAFRGAGGYGEARTGKAVYVTKSSLVNGLEGKVAIISVCDESYEPVFAKAAGIVLQNLSSDKSSEKFAIEFAERYQTSLITGAESDKVFINERELTMNPEKAVVLLSK